MRCYEINPGALSQTQLSAKNKEMEVILEKAAESLRKQPQQAPDPTKAAYVTAGRYLRPYVPIAKAGLTTAREAKRLPQELSGLIKEENGHYKLSDVFTKDLLAVSRHSDDSKLVAEITELLMLNNRVN
jgi:hypothetical protein